MKSRISRARATLEKMLTGDEAIAEVEERDDKRLPSEVSVPTQT